MCVCVLFKDDGNYLGWKPSPNEPYKWLKYSEVEAIAHQLGSAFIELGLEPGNEAFVGIFARNRVEVFDFLANLFIFIDFLNKNLSIKKFDLN